jgi:hypothetical protein
MHCFFFALRNKFAYNEERTRGVHFFHHKSAQS